MSNLRHVQVQVLGASDLSGKVHQPADKKFQPGSDKIFCRLRFFFLLGSDFFFVRLRFFSGTVQIFFPGRSGFLGPGLAFWGALVP